MKNVLPYLLLLLAFTGTAQEQEEERGHWDPTHNFTVQRLIILNDQGEMLMTRQEHVWATPSAIFETRQYIKEGMDSLALAYGVSIDDLEFRGHFSYKYEYHPFATIRAYYVAKYVCGDILLPEGYDEVQWVPIADAIAMTNVTSIQEITRQIIEDPNTVWGGSFLVRRVGIDHPAEMVEPFYPMFSKK